MGISPERTSNHVGAPHSATESGPRSGRRRMFEAPRAEFAPSSGRELKWGPTSFAESEREHPRRFLTTESTMGNFSHSHFLTGVHLRVTKRQIFRGVMNHFQYRNNELYCEGVPLRDLAEECGTPLYVYSHATLRRHYQVFDEAFSKIPHLTCYAVKANSNIALLRLLAGWGAGMDVVSGGELYRALAAGVEPSKIVFAGVGKTEREIEEAQKAGILMFNVESREELGLINKVAREKGLRPRVALRINPAIDPRTHRHIATGSKESKFGIDSDQILQGYREALQMEHLEVAGIHAHIGSQITEIGPFREAIEKLARIVAQVRTLGVDLRYVDIGGGLGITYEREEPPEPQQFAAALLPALQKLSCTLLTEPGRVLVGNAGILLTRLLYRKESGGKSFMMVDAGMNDLIRPGLYGSYHGIQPVRESSGERTRVDVVGPICESGDFLARDRELPAVSPGEYLAVMSAGAYGFVMSSHYNSRPRAAEVLVQGGKYSIIRERETYQDLIRGENLSAVDKEGGKISTPASPLPK